MSNVSLSPYPLVVCYDPLPLPPLYFGCAALLLLLVPYVLTFFLC